MKPYNDLVAALVDYLSQGFVSDELLEEQLANELIPKPVATAAREVLGERKKERLKRLWVLKAALSAQSVGIARLGESLTVMERKELWVPAPIGIQVQVELKHHGPDGRAFAVVVTC